MFLMGDKIQTENHKKHRLHDSFKFYYPTMVLATDSDIVPFSFLCSIELAQKFMLVGGLVIWVLCLTSTRVAMR